MSFRGDDSRRYGHVPPAQYPVANQAPDQAYPPRRQSFNTSDDGSFFGGNNGPPQGYQPQGERDDEHFVGNPGDPHGSAARPGYAQQSTAMAGYQHQYQGQPAPAAAHSYNPQHFAPPPSTTTLPYHPQPSARFATPSSPTYASPPPTNYTPQAYNPAAYATTAFPQRHPSMASYNSYSYGTSPAPTQAPTGYGQQPYSPQPPASTWGQQPAPAPPAQSLAYDQQSPVYSPQYPSSSGPPTVSSQYDPYPSSYSTQSNQYFGQYPNGAAAAASAPTSSYSNAPPQAPYPAQSQIPVGPAYDPNSFMLSQTSPVPSPPPNQRASSSPGLQRHPTNAPLPSRPADDTPPGRVEWDPSDQQGDDDSSDEHATQENLMQDIESNLGGTASHRQRPINGNLSDEDLERLRRYDSRASTINTQSGDPGVNRFTSNASTVNRNNVTSTYGYGLDEDESDPEAAAGLIAMQQDENDRRFSAGSFPYADPQAGPPQLPPPPPQQQQQQLQHQQVLPPPHRPLSTQPEEQGTSDSDFGGMDLGMYGGGYAGNLTYGNDVGSPPATGSTLDGGRPFPTPQSQGNDGYPPFSEVSVDYVGTGGLQAPQSHRLSFDEGEERVSLHSPQSGSESPYKEDYPDMFYHPGIGNRPLPAVPASDSGSLLSVVPPNRGPYQHGYSHSADSRSPYDPSGLEVYPGQASGQQQQVDRSHSLSSHSNTPQVQAPARSRTDAAEERRRVMKQMTQQQQLAAQQGLPYDGYDTGTPSSLAAYDLPTLPTGGRKRKFIPSKLASADFKKCEEPWALSGITAWLREMVEGEPDLKRKTIEDGLVRLFTAKVPTMNVADAELLGTYVVDSLLEAQILVPDEEWVKFGQGELSGVLWQLTGSGCYAQKLHEDESFAPRLHENGLPLRCYSHHCGRTLKKANLDQLMSEEVPKSSDWAETYGLTVELLSTKDKKEVERQNILHEIVTSEEVYMNELDVLRLLYKNQLRAWQPPIIPANRIEKFIDNVFGKVDIVQQTNKDHLLAQLKYRQQEQGPWISGFSDIFREWIRKARSVYLDYCSAYPYAEYLIRKEADRNILFRQFLDMVRDHKRSRRLDWTSHVKSPITRLQRYSLLLETALRKTAAGSDEHENLSTAIKEIKSATLECDDKVDEMKKKVSLLELQSQLVLRPGFQSVLNLDHLGRELIKQGDLQRMGSKGVRWVDTHALLFDHYLILAKAVVGPKAGLDKKYDVSKEPIPMPLLFLESRDDDPVSKQKGLTAPLARTTAATGSDTKLNKVTSNGDRPGLEHTATSSSMGSLNTVGRLGTANSNEEGKILYPFRVKHLGHEVYTLYTTSLADRLQWCNALVEAKTRHAKALYAQNAEPFKLRVLADSAFAYDSVSAAGRQSGVPIQGTPLDRAIREMAKVYGAGRGPPPVCRATVNCSTAFTAYGKSLIAIGTDFGVYISESSNPRGWTRSVQINRVTQISVLEEFSVCLLIADKSLISYPLDVIAPVSNYPAPTHDNPRKAPQRLAKDVSFFATARMKDRMLLFYKRKEGLHNTFKVLEPVFQKATEKKTRLFGAKKGGSGATESFRDFDEFYLPTECYSLNLFQTYVSIASAKGFELLTLDKKVPMSIPRDLSLPAIANIASRIRDQRPLGMFKLNDQEFILTYEDCAVYIDKHGEVSRTLIMEYSGKQKKAKGATMFGQYLLLFNEDYVEVRNAENGRLRQIIAGRDVRCLDYGFRGPTGLTPPAAQSPGVLPAGQLPPDQMSDPRNTVKICMSHPEVPGGQIVLEMLLNDGHSEKS